MGRKVGTFRSNQEISALLCEKMLMMMNLVATFFILDYMLMLLPPCFLQLCVFEIKTLVSYKAASEKASTSEFLKFKNTPPKQNPGHNRALNRFLVFHKSVSSFLSPKSLLFNYFFFFLPITAFLRQTTVVPLQSHLSHDFGTKASFCYECRYEVCFWKHPFVYRYVPV